MEAHRINWSDPLRGIACLAVVFSHFSEFSISSQFIGHAAVTAFFLLSGFLVPHAIAGKSPLGYFVGRILRLWPTWSVCLLLTVAAGWAFGADLPEFSAIAWNLVPGAADLAGAPVIDSVIWSLEAEARFAVLIACLLPWLRAPGAVLVYVPTALQWVAIVAAGCGGAGVEIATDCAWQCVMFAGVCASVWQSSKSSVSALGAASSIIAALGCSLLGKHEGWLWLLWPAELFGLGCFVAAWLWGHRLWSWSAALGRVSYPVYCGHCGAGLLSVELLGRAELPAVVSWSVGLGIVVVQAAVVARVVERPSAALGRRLSRAGMESFPRFSGLLGGGCPAVGVGSPHGRGGR